MLLVDKYKPKRMEEILGNKEIISTLQSIESNFPHLLLTGPPGTGKTTVAHILKASFDCLELNASDERGIDVIRTRVKNFALKKADRKLIILDECDSLTAPAQQSLRRMMELSGTKFILICNQISNVIEPVQSRCSILKFDRISRQEFEERVKEICSAEGIELVGSGFKALSDLGGGDMRATLNCLQALLNLKRPIDGDFLYKLNGVPSTEAIQNIFSCIKNRQTNQIHHLFESLWAMKYEPSDLMSGFFKAAKAIENYEALRVIGQYHLRISEGNSSKLQFYSMFNELISLFK